MQQLADLLDLPKKILEKTGERTIVVFDEFQDFLRTTGDLDGLLRSKMQTDHDAASCIFCASEPALLEAHFADRKRPLFDPARPLYLAPLSDPDLADYIGDRFERTGRDAGEALDLLLDLVRGHPQRAVLLAHHLWERTPTGRTADAAIFDAALAAMDRETKERFEYNWAQLSQRSAADHRSAARAMGAPPRSARPAAQRRRSCRCGRARIGPAASSSPVNPAPPGGARKEARQRQAAVQKGEEGGSADASEQAQDGGGDLAESPLPPHGSAMSRHHPAEAILAGSRAGRPIGSRGRGRLSSTQRSGATATSRRRKSSKATRLRRRTSARPVPAAWFLSR